MFSTKPVKLPFLVFGNVLFPNAKQVIKVEEPKYLFVFIILIDLHFFFFFFFCHKFAYQIKF